MKVTIKRAGLHTFASLSGADPREVDAAAGDGSPRGRLKRVQEQAKAYPNVKRLHGEIKWIEDHINMPKLSLTLSYALTAVERGLALLDTEQHLRAVIKHGATKAGGKAGAQKTNTLKIEIARKKTERAAELFKRYRKLGKKPEIIKSELINKHGFSPRSLDDHLAAARKSGLLPASRSKQK